MHPYNPYEFFPPDFAALAAKSEKLARLTLRSKARDVRKDASDEFDKTAKYIDNGIGDGFKSDNGQDEIVYIDFRDADSSIALTEAMLEHDFGIHVSLRNDRLCPAIPNRINYIAWLQEIVDKVQSIAECVSHLEKNGDEERPAKRIKQHPESVRILDVGTGASCIYPILGCALDDWNFIATDIDAESIAAARSIVDDPSNQGVSQAEFTHGRRLDLQNRIELCLRGDGDSVLPSEEDLKSLKLDAISWPHLDEGLLYHAVMCNPPFYKDEVEMQHCQDGKVRGPSAVCLGSEREMICKGGETAFVTRIIDESVHLQDRVLFFTCTLGKASDIDPIVKRLIEVKAETVMLTEFTQGRTKRWGIAWSFLPYRLDTGEWHSNHLSLPLLGPLNDTRYTRSLQIEPVLSSDEKERFVNMIKWLSGFSLRWEEVDESTLVVGASSNSWNRAARRARLRGEQEQLLQGKKCILCVRLLIEGNTLKATWMYGLDKATWDSFFGIVLQGWVRRIAALESTAAVK